MTDFNIIYSNNYVYYSKFDFSGDSGCYFVGLCYNILLSNSYLIGPITTSKRPNYNQRLRNVFIRNIPYV